MDDLLRAFEGELRRQGRSPHTVRNYIARVRSFLTWLSERYGETDPAAVTVLDVRDYQSYCLTVKKYAPAGIKQRLSAIREYCDFLVGTGRLPGNPAKEVQPVQAPKRSAPDVLTRSELNQLRREVYKGGDPRDIAIFELLLQTGIRASELIALHLDDIEISERKGSLTVRSGKGRKYREVPLSAEARKAIANYLAVRPATDAPNLFLGERGPLKTTDAVAKILKKYARRVGLEHKVHPHLLRHQFATELLRNKKADLVLVAELLGHQSVTTTMIYTKPTEEEKASAVENLFR